VNALHDLVMNHRTVVCVGSGGVGKTTTSAIVALHAAQSGRRVLVLTIDPAKRLADSLGLDGIGNEASRVPLEELLDEEVSGELWAMMLDMKSSFDDVVRRNTTPDATERILSNRYYQSFSSSLSGTQEYSAIERLWELSTKGDYDLIVLDTPPTQHAVDFLDAPDRLYSAIDSSALQWLYRPALASGKVGLGILRRGAKAIRGVLSKLTGSQMLDDLTVFLEGLAPLFDGLKERAGNVRNLLHDPATVFLVVTSPDPLTVAEAVLFDDKLHREKVHFGGFVVNRVHRPVLGSGEAPPKQDLVSHLRRIPGAGHVSKVMIGRLAGKLLRNTADFDALAQSDRRTLDKLGARHDVPVFPIPFYATDICSIQGLNRVRADLFALQ